MTLIVSMQYEGKIVIAADGMAYTQGENNANIPYPTDKLHQVKSTDWICTFSGWGGVQSFQRAIESEIEAGYSPPLDSRLPVAGPAYLEALSAKAREGVPKQSAHVALAGFDLEGKPYILSRVIPNGGTYSLPPIAALGVQESTAAWLMNTLFPCCESLEDVKRLACFAIFQVAKQEIKVGRPEYYGISLAVLENGKPTQRQQKTYAEMLNWLNGWEQGLQRCFMSIIQCQIKGNSPAI